MTSLFGRMLPLFTGVRRVEDLFTEVVARLFERRPDICLGWLEELALTSPTREDRPRYVHVSTQRTFVRLDKHETDSRPDLIVGITFASGDDESEPCTEIMLIESKIRSWEGKDQLKRYAAHLSTLPGVRKTLVYITRAYDPKVEEEILIGTQGIRFRQLRWHDFYRFLQSVKKDALAEEVMLFMEEQGMARSHRLSAADLMALASLPRAFEILDETLGGEVRAELESLAGSRVRREAVGLNLIRSIGRYAIFAPLRENDQYHYYAGYKMSAPDGYPAAYVGLEARAGAPGRKEWVAAMNKIVHLDGWEGHGLDDPTRLFGVSREITLADLLSREDHVAAIKLFFVESTRELREELAAFKGDRPDLP